MREYAREWRAAHPERVQQYGRKFREQNPDYYREYRRNHPVERRHPTKPRVPAEDFIADPSDPRHGTSNGYSNLKCRCDRCREAWAAAHAKYMERRREREAMQAKEEADTAQDIRAMRAARRWDTARDIARAMQGLGRWTPEAQRAYAEVAERFGQLRENVQPREGQ